MNVRTKITEPLSIDFSLKSVMSLMVALIPVVLFSAEFSKISVIETSQSSGGVHQQSEERYHFKKTTIPIVVITDTTMTIINGSEVLPSVNYQRLVGIYPFSEDRYVINRSKEELELLDFYFSSLRHALPLNRYGGDTDALENEWRKLYQVAWTDFHRFLKG